MIKEELKKYLEQTFPSNKVEETFDFPLMFVDKTELLSVAQKLKESPETLFDFLFCETAVDRNPNLEVVFHLNSTTHHHDMVLKVVLTDRENPELPSVYSLWKAAELYENEIYDMFGIRFSNHPNLRRIMLGDEWPGFPLRKDYKDNNNIVTL
ncbi:MAG TPA: NADH-quinone oxidoreductase subunit C [Bacteroidales bacterium]|nr:NADH-quinone oxidoreductase subunit C [Bacteroidales bacterium]